MEVESNNYQVDEETGQVKQGKYRDEGYVAEEEGVNWLGGAAVLVLALGAGALIVSTLQALG